MTCSLDPIPLQGQTRKVHRSLLPGKEEGYAAQLALGLLPLTHVFPPVQCLRFMPMVESRHVVQEPVALLSERLKTGILAPDGSLRYLGERIPEHADEGHQDKRPEDKRILSHDIGHRANLRLTLWRLR